MLTRCKKELIINDRFSHMHVTFWLGTSSIAIPVFALDAVATGD